MPSLIGNKPNQVPTNGDLGTLAFQDSNAVQITGGSVATTSTTLGSASANPLTINSSAVSIPNGLNFDSNTLVIDATNNRVGVGVASPATQFHIYEPTAATTARFLLNSAVTGAAITDGFGITIDTASIAYLDQKENADLVLRTNATERMRITSTGNVGIGTNSPATKLDVLDATNVYRQINLTETKSANTRNRTGITGQSYGGTTPVQAFLIDANTSINDIYFGGSISSSYAATNLVFYTAANNTTTTGTERMRITSGGLVGIATNSPTATLDVNADTVRVRTARTPASATAAGNAGDICWDANYIYVCTATNTWKRAAIATW